jgi:hypothetical protein
VGGFTIVWFPDTHYSTTSLQTTYLILGNWVVANKDRLNIQAIMHVGDLVNSGSTHDYQWQNAEAMIDLLDAANMPYLLAPGNHDYDDEVAISRASSKWNEYFGQARYTAKDWWAGGFYEVGKSENAYNILTIGGEDYLFLALELGPREGVLAWADALLTTHADKKTIITTHSHLDIDGTLVTDTDNSNPRGYAGIAADAHVGTEVWDELIKLHDNIIWIQSGHHYVGGNAARLQSLSTGGAKVNQVFANYQDSDKNGGDGFIRLLKFDPATRTVTTETISPLACDEKTEDAHSFTLDY